MAALDHLETSRLSPPHDLAAGLLWLLRSGFCGTSIEFGRFATDAALSCLLVEPHATLTSIRSLTLIDCREVTDAFLSDAARYAQKSLLLLTQPPTQPPPLIRPPTSLLRRPRTRTYTRTLVV